MIMWIVAAGAVIVIAIIALSLIPEPENERKKYLDSLARFVEGQMEPVEGPRDSYRLRFRYLGKDFVYEDIQEEGFQGRRFYQGYLRTAAGTDLVLSFTERERTGIIDTSSVFRDRQYSPKIDSGEIILPKKLKCFNVYTNNPVMINNLLADVPTAEAFSRFMNMDNRGHPFMALEILQGVIVLRFYSTSGYKPGLFDLRDNVTKIEMYLDMLIRIVDKITELRRQQELTGETG